MTVEQKSANPQRDVCKLCGEAVEHIFSARVLGKYEVGYFHCNHCGLIQTEKPYWLEEAYSEALSAADTGVMFRNLWLMKMSAVLLRIMKMQGGSFLDFGGGHGVFTRLMRDCGYDFHCWDPHAKNLFARGFGGNPDNKYDGVTAFEVLEHLPDPGTFFERILGRMEPNMLLVSTELFAEPVNPQWRYFYFPTGQHITFYQPGTLAWLAERYDYRCITAGTLHLFVKSRKPGILNRLALRFGHRFYPLLRFTSLVEKDHQLLLNGLREDDD